MNKKVEIIIDDSNNYYDNDEEIVKKFISVDYSGNNYGGGFPCDTPEDIERAIKYAKETIIKEGDKPVIVDKREISKLTKWF